jgi:alpha-amylase
MLIAHDHKPTSLNLIDTLMRREEAYHTKLSEAVVVDPETQEVKSTAGSTSSIHDIVRAKEPGLEKLLTPDWHRRSSLIDHFLADGATLTAFHSATHGEDGDFVNQPYRFKSHARAGKGHIRLWREGALYKPAGVFPVRVEKTVRVNAESSLVDITYQIINQSGRPITTRFGVEFNVNLLAGEAHDRYVFVEGHELADRQLASMGENRHVTHCGLVDEWMGVRVDWRFDDEVTLWRCPIETVSLSEAGFERVYQSTVMLPHWDELTIPIDGEWTTHFTMEVSQLG